MAEFAGAIVTGIVIAVVTAVVTVRLSVRQFKSERWWERKADAYTELLDRLVGLHRVSRRLEMIRQAGAAGEPLKIPNDALDELTNHLTALRTEVTRGSFVIAQDAIDPIQNYLDKHAVASERMLERTIELLPGIIKKVREVGKKDLGV